MKKSSLCSYCAHVLCTLEAALEIRCELRTIHVLVGPASCFGANFILHWVESSLLLWTWAFGRERCLFKLDSEAYLKGVHAEGGPQPPLSWVCCVSLPNPVHASGACSTISSAELFRRPPVQGNVYTGWLNASGWSGLILYWETKVLWEKALEAITGWIQFIDALTIPRKFSLSLSLSLSF